MDRRKSPIGHADFVHPVIKPVEPGVKPWVPDVSRCAVKGDRIISVRQKIPHGTDKGEGILKGIFKVVRAFSISGKGVGLRNAGVDPVLHPQGVIKVI